MLRFDGSAILALSRVTPVVQQTTDARVLFENKTKLTFEDYNKTLTDEEVMPIFNKIIENVEKKFNAKLRSM